MTPTNTAYGYPRGAERRIAPRRLIAIHITGNTKTPIATALEEATYANRAGSNGPSAHTYIDRDGSIEPFVDTRYAAWSNGAIRSPKTSVPGVKDVVALTATNNANEDYFREVECVGRAGMPITTAQRNALAKLIAEDSEATGLPINRSTVHLHSDLDTEQRPNDPVPAADSEAFAGDIIARALTLRLANAEAAVKWLTDAYQTGIDERTRLMSELSSATRQRDAFADWGDRLQSHGAVILATDRPVF